MARLVIYPTNIDSFKQGDIVKWSRDNGCVVVLEEHWNAFNGTATGTESWITSQYGADPFDIALPATLAETFGVLNRGVKQTTNLANVNRMAAAGLGYVLIEYMFGDNPSDYAKFKDATRVGSITKSIIDKYYPGDVVVGIVKGHGQGDPGATGADGSSEANWVRQITYSGTPPVPERKGYDMKAVLVSINAKCTIVNKSNFHMLNNLDSVRTDIRPLEAGETVILHHAFIQDQVHPNLYYAMAYRPSEPDAVGLIQVEDIRNGAKWVNYKYISGYLPPKPVTPKLDVKKVEPYKGVLKSDLYYCSLDPTGTKVVQDKTKLYKTGQVLNVNYEILYEDILYLFTDIECKVGTAYGKKPYTSTNIVKLGDEIK